MADTPQQRLRYICLIGIAALAPWAFVLRQYQGERRDAGIMSLIGLFFVTFYIWSDRRRE
jgi:hypothetical protein